MRRISAHYIFPITAPPLRNAVITLSDDGVILDVSRQNRFVQEGDGIEFYNGIIVPAFVNAHCHLELSYMRDKIERGCGIAGFIRQVGSIRYQETEPKKIKDAIKYANALLYQSGTGACIDISNSDNSFEIKAGKKIKYYTFIEKYGLLPSQNGQHLQEAQALLGKAHQVGLAASITPHAPYSVSGEFMQTLINEALPSNIVSIHHQESQAEQELFEYGKGSLAEQFAMIGLMPPPANGLHSLQYLAQYIPRQMRLMLVHNTYMNEVQYDFAASHWDNICYVLCPLSNLYIENALPPVEMLHSRGAYIALGTDSFASHPTLMLLDDMILLQQYYQQIPLEEVLTWATINGAKFMGMDDKFGSIETGKCPGLVWIEGLEYLPNVRLLKTAKAQRISFDTASLDHISNLRRWVKFLRNRIYAKQNDSSIL